MVYMIDENGNELLCEEKLSALEKRLDSTMFFRANRQYIVNINFIKSFKPCDRVKLIVKPSLNLPKHIIIVSQQTAPRFKKWIAGK
jgi:DNA-binding LytR/AlgR family response regulator